jgi:hypothetical protein
MNEEVTILTTEHFTSQSARGACLQDMQGRASLFLTSVSGSLIALGFLGSATQFGPGFALFATVLLGTLWVLGLLTFLRVAQIGVEDTILAFGIARIRHRYIELVPQVADRITRTSHDDIAGLKADLGGADRWWQALMPMESLISFLVSVIAAADVSVIFAVALHAVPLVAIVAGIAAGIASLLTLRRFSIAIWSSAEKKFPAKFPSPKS